MRQLRRVLSRSVLALLFVGAGPAPLLLGQTASLVADLQAAPADAESRIPHDVGTFGESALFQVFEFPSLGSQMWVSDGTGSGTRPIQDAGEHRALFLGAIGRVVFWSSGLDLWRSDGTQDGTFRLSGPDTLQLGTGSDPTGPLFAFAEGSLYFIGCTDDLGCEIWRTDGTQEGTRIVQDLTPGRDDSPIQEIGTAGHQVFVLLAGGLRAVESNGTHLLLTFQGRNSDLWAAAQGRLFFRLGNAVWATDGTPEGTRSLMESSGTLSWPLTAAPGGLYFMASESGRAWEIWKSDGTPEGTRRVSELPGHIGIFESYGLDFAAEIGDSLLFLAYGSTGSGWSLWQLSVKSGTVVPAGDGVVRSKLFQAGGRVLFVLQGEEGCDVWSVDAKRKTTRLVTGLSCGTFAPENFVPYVISGDHFYFSGFTSSALQIWKSDGTTAGTELLLSVPSSGALRDIAVSPSGRRVFVTVEAGLWLWEQSSGARQLLSSGPRTGSADLSDLLSIGSRLFFSVCTTERNLWTSTGTAAGTEPLTSFSGEFCHGDLAPVVAGTSLFFLDPTHQELWKTDAAGSAPVLLIRDLGLMNSLVAHQGRAWFVVRAGAHSEIWTSDGTPAGTHAATALPGDTQITTRLYAAGDLLYFTARSTLDGQNLTEIWRSDGTAAGTIRIAETPGYEGRDFVHLGSFVYFLSFQGLWRTDGTAAGTVPLSEAGVEIDLPSHLVEHAGSLYLFGTRSPSDLRLTLWRTNGAPENTIPVAIFPRELHSTEDPTLVSSRGKLFFALDDDIHGTELWVSDGTSAGTALVSDLAPGPASSGPEHLTAAGDALYFSAHDGAHGKELWRTDGTAAGTRLVQDIAPESLSSSPAHLTIAGDHLYFVADDGLTGRELWKLPLQDPGCQPSSTRLCLNGGRFQIEAVWRDFQGRIGRGMASSLTGDTGYFWFFDPANAEVVLKVLDGRGLNDHYWIFYGALSNVEYAITVTDTQTGLARRYLNPSGQLASVGDTQGFGPLGAHSATPEPLVALPSPPALVSGRTVPAAATGSCQPGPQRLCLNGGRFAVEASWKDFRGKTGTGTAVSLSADTGYFWFFDQTNVEVLLKVLDGTPLNGKFWVFYGALSNVEYTLTVTDTQTGAVKEYRNPSGRFASVADTGAF